MQRYLLNTVTGVISKEGTSANDVVVRATEVEVKGGFQLKGVKADGTEFTATLTEAEYFDGKDFVIDAVEEVTETAVVDTTAVEGTGVIEFEKTIGTTGGKFVGSILKVRDDLYVATISTGQKEYKTLRGARAFMERNDYIEVGEAKPVKKATKKSTKKATKKSTKAKSNRAILDTEARLVGLQIECYDKDMDKLSKAELSKVIEALDYGSSTDVDVYVKGKLHVVEVVVMEDNTVDFGMLSQAEYIDRYGDERWWDEE